MKLFIIAASFFVVFVAVITAGISYNGYINRNKEHVYSPEEIAAIECSKRGGNPSTRVGWDNGIHVQEYKCEGAK